MKQTGKWLILFLALACFWLGVTQLQQDQQAADIRQLEEALRRTAVACYAAEGAYPPNLDYMCRNYGLTYDETRFQVYYIPFASNLMPEITVLEKDYEK